MMTVPRGTKNLYIRTTLSRFSMSKDRTLTFEAESAQTARTGGVNYLLMIGIDVYAHISSLENAVRDAKAVCKVLQKRYQFEAQHTTSLYDEAASREHIITAFDELSDKITPKDNLLIYFAGHGYFREKVKIGYWVPADARDKKYADYITHSEVRNYIRGIPSHHTLLIVDSCFSGNLLRGQGRSSSSTTIHANKVDRFPSRWCLAAGMIEKVSDGYIGAHSPFAQSLITFLQKNEDARFPVQDLITHVSKATSYNADQTPIGGVIEKTGDQNGQFVFDLKGDFKFKKDEEQDWKTCKDTNSVQAYRAFVKAWSGSQYAEDAWWRIATLSEELTAYRTYIRKFRRGKFVRQALEKIKTSESERAFERAMKQAPSMRLISLIEFINDYPQSELIDRAEAEIDRLEAEPESPVTDKAVSSIKVNHTTAEIQIPDGFMEMVRVEGGTFQMGSNNDDSEKPIHTVTLSLFEIGKYPVTQKLWEVIMGNPSNFKDCSQCPVGSISWNDVQEFLKKLNATYPGMNYRLPTEAEWEFAARGGNMSKGYTYAGSNEINEVGWYWQNSGDKPLTGDWNWRKMEKNNGRKHPVGQKKANELGIYDMSGNVWEWCSYWYDEYPNAPQVNPQGPSEGPARILRGGSWLSHPGGLRVASRGSGNPDSKSGHIGFRLARTP